FARKDHHLLTLARTLVRSCDDLGRRNNFHVGSRSIMAWKAATGARRVHGSAADRFSQKFRDLFGSDRTGAKNREFAAAHVNNCRFKPNVAFAPVEYEINAVAELRGNVLGPRTTH